MWSSWHTGGWTLLDFLLVSVKLIRYHHLWLSFGLCAAIAGSTLCGISFFQDFLCISPRAPSFSQIISNFRYPYRQLYRNINAHQETSVIALTCARVSVTKVSISTFTHRPVSSELTRGIWMADGPPNTAAALDWAISQWGRWENREGRREKSVEDESLKGRIYRQRMNMPKHSGDNQRLTSIEISTKVSRQLLSEIDKKNPILAYNVNMFFLSISEKWWSDDNLLMQLHKTAVLGKRTFRWKRCQFKKLNSPRQQSYSTKESVSTSCYATLLTTRSNHSAFCSLKFHIQLHFRQVQHCSSFVCSCLTITYFQGAPSQTSRCLQLGRIQPCSLCPSVRVLDCLRPSR